ncbi:MAG: DUF1847 domain-containing protein [bacterium]
MSDFKDPKCAVCGIPLFEKACFVDGGKGPDFCPTRHGADLIEEAREEYKDPGIKEFARLSSVQEGECYLEKDRQPYIPHCGKTRIQEVCEFAEKIGAKKLGIAYCIGLAREAGMLNDIFEHQGFEVTSVVCKVGRILKEEELGVKDEEKIMIGTAETACNPILQAKLLNRAGVDLNVLLGLCVGHDSLFLKYAKGYTTVLAVKDRVTGHNPLAALYTSHSYYMFMHRQGF